MIKHSEGWNVDRCAQWMKRTGTAFDWCYPASGQPFPALDQYTGVIVFGGAISANDGLQHDWIRQELAFIEQCLKQDKAFFGICLGAQMLASVLGSSVTKHPEDAKEVGFCEVKPTAKSGAFMPRPLKVMQWHSEGFELPAGTTHLACNDVFPNQAFSVNEHIVGVQFHPEVNLDVLRIWHERNKQKPSGILSDAQRAEHVADAIAHDADITAWLDAFLTGWTHRAVRAA